MRAWPAEGVTRIPYWVYSDPELYAREQQRVFGGPFWSYVALECEIASPGDFVSTWIGEQPVVVVRQPDGSVRAFLNRCAHRGVAFCRAPSGHADELMCPYHQWVYDLAGDLLAAPFRKGVKGHGGMPDDFELSDHGLTLVAGRASATVWCSRRWARRRLSTSTSARRCSAGSTASSTDATSSCSATCASACPRTGS